jgi:zinc protease
MARNYLMGHLMTQLDGPFSTMDFISTMKIEQLPDSAFGNLVSAIQHLSSRELRELAIKYLDLEHWSTIVVR